MTEAKITLFLMTKKGLNVLQAIIEEGYSEMVDFVVIGEDKQTKSDYSSEIRELCKTADISTWTRSDAPAVKTSFALAISWRWMIKDLKAKLIVVHDSLLPHYRGFAPLVNQLLKGEKRIGVTSLFASDDYDRGPIISQKSIDINYPIKIDAAIDMVSGIYAEMVIEILDNLDMGSPLMGQPQEEKNATYSLWRDEEDYRISWHKSAEEIGRLIDSVSFPYKGAKCLLNGKEIRILDSEVQADVNIEIRQPGKVIFIQEGFPVVVCGSGLLKILIANFEEDGTSALPLQKFRSRFS